jgi:hypothetical protein
MKYENSNCKSEMKFEECELAILRQAVDETEKITQEKIANSDEIKKMVKIVENFLIRKKCICYGGTAINNILPKHAQFYNRDIEIPDYDFFSPNALKDAKELADIYFQEGYQDVEAKSGVHFGTYKVFVNFIPMADITEMNASLFRSVLKETIEINQIHYAPANYLRMNMFIELSRPKGDVSRWEKVLKRLNLLNEYYPLNSETIDCQQVDFQRNMESLQTESEKIYFVTRDTFIEQDAIFFGGFASSLYSKYMPEETKHLVKSIPDFDVLSEDPDLCASILKNKLEQLKLSEKIHIIKHTAIDEIIPRHLEIRIGKEMIAFIYEPIACHNYNIISLPIDKQNPKVEKRIRVATIDTMLSFYLAFLYANKNYYYKDRILCIAKFLFDVEQKNRLEQKGLLKRFSIECYGKSNTIENIRAEKARMFQELKNKKNTEEYEKWFLKYNPSSYSYSSSFSSVPYKKKTKKRLYKRRKNKRHFHFLLNHTRRKRRKKDIWLI